MTAGGVGWPVATAADLRAAGIGADRARTLRRRGGLVPLWHGVDLHPRHPPDARLHAAASLADCALLSGPSAARAWGYDVPARWPDEITVDSQLRHRQGLRVVRRPVAAAHRAVAGKLPVTSEARTVADVLCRPWLDTLWLLDQALVRGLDTAAVEACLEPGQRGCRRARRLLPLGRPGAESPLESRVRLSLVSAGLPEPALQHVVTTDGRFVARVDLAWPELRLGLEADGVAWHGDPAALHGDRVRQNALAILGWTVLRATWADTYDPERLVAVVAQALATASRARRV